MKKMKTIFFKILITFFTFLIGIGASLCWNSLSANRPSELSNLLTSVPMPTQTSTCRLVDEPNWFDGKLVSFEAIVYVIRDGTVILLPKDCFKPDPFVFIRLELNSYTGTNSNLKTFLKSRNRTSEGDLKEVDVKIIGTAKIIYDVEGYKWFSITPTNINIISAFRKFEPKGAA